MSIITASALYDYVHCPHRVYLDRYGDYTKKDAISPFIRLLWERGHAYEKEIIDKITRPVTDLSDLESKDKETATLEAIQGGDELIYSGRIIIDNLVGEPDLLMQRGVKYVAGDIKSGAGLETTSDLSASKPKKHYTVQLALYTDILSRLGFCESSQAFIWDINGDEIVYDFKAPLSKTSHITLWQFYEECERTVDSILSKSLTTSPAFSSLCKLCHWRSFCFEDLKTHDDLTLIPELGRSKRDALSSEMQTIQQLAQVELSKFAIGEKTIFQGISLSSLQKFKLRAQLLKNPKAIPFLTGTLDLPTSDVEIFFDVETDPMRDICYLHGFYTREKSHVSGEYLYFFADEPIEEKERAAFAQAFKYVSSNPNAIIYYYSKYERTIWRKLQQKYPSICTVDDIEGVFSESCSVDLYFDVVKKHVEWPTHNHSIKTLAGYLGFSWKDEDPSGASSIEWYHRWVDNKDPQIKRRILEYNEDDCVATAVLLDGIRNLLWANRMGSL